MATTKTDCEAYMRALEEQSDAIKASAEGMLMAINIFKDSVESVLRTVDNIKRMIEMTRQTMVLAHGGRVVERVEIKREPDEEEEWDSGSVNTHGEDWDAELDESRCFALPVYRTVKFTRWANRCPACGGRYCSSCA